MAKSSQPLLSVQVVSPQEILFSGPCLSVSSKNLAGNFDILPQHANFITIVENSPITIRQPNKPKVEFKFPLAIIYTKNNKVGIYTQLQLPQL